MEKIIQLTETEYNELRNEANLKRSDIEQQAQELYQKKGTYGINLELKTQGFYSERLSFHAKAYVRDWDGQFPISYKDKCTIVQFVEARALKMMEDRFGRQISSINYYNKRVDSLNRLRTRFIGLTVFGWLAALTLTVIALMK